jgi:tetratricopeptide (TPR) repeat protein
MKPISNYFLISGALFLLAGNVFAQPIEKGIELNEAGMYETAKAFLLEGIQSAATAEAYYYLGDTYLMLNKEDSASYYFQQSIAANPEYFLPLVGEGKRLLKKNDVAAAEELFKQAIKADKKNPAIYTAIASAYVEYNLPDKAPAMYEKARSGKTKNYPPSYIVEGDMLAKMNKTSEACQKYSNASYFDPQYKLSHLKEARAYKSINTARALELLDVLAAIDADYVPACVEYVDIYYSLGYFKKAIPMYEKFVDLPGISTKDLEKYATVLYFSQEYTKSLGEIKKVLQSDPENFIMRRLEFYNHFDLGNDAMALGLGAKFFASKETKDEYIAQDYVSYAKLLSKNKQDLNAVEYYKKALELDSTKVDLYKDISTAYEKAENYADAIAFYQKYMDRTESPKVSEYYSFGRSYYQAGTQSGAAGDTIAQREYLLKADSLFAIVTEKNGDSYLGYIWRARSLASLDPELTLALAKPLYEQVLEKLLSDKDVDKRKKELTECYMYLGNYYYLNKDKENTLLNFNKVLELNPENSEMKKVVGELFK